MDSRSALLRSWWVWVADAAVVVSFAVIGGESHGFGSPWREVLRISAPFLIALAIATAILVWILTPRIDWLTPTSVAAGAWQGAVTLIGGMLLRRFVFDAGTASVFVAITSAWFIGLMVGWRLLYSAARAYGRRLVASRR